MENNSHHQAQVLGVEKSTRHGSSLPWRPS